MAASARTAATLTACLLAVLLLAAACSAAAPQAPQAPQAPPPQGSQRAQRVQQATSTAEPVVCTTPLGKEGHCIALNTCRPLLALLRASRARSSAGPRGLPDSEVTVLLRMSQCGFRGNTVMVCCPPDDGSTYRTKPEQAENAGQHHSYAPPPSSSSSPAAAQRPHVVSPLSSLGDDAVGVAAAGEAGQGHDGQGQEGGLPGWPDLPDGSGDPSENIALLPVEVCGLRFGQQGQDAGQPGQRAAGMQYPWMARLGYRHGDGGDVEYLCSGSLISERYVLTAAHCIGVHNGPVTVRLGDRDAESDPDCEDSVCAPNVVDVDVEARIVHEQYERGVNDIALLRLVRPVAFTEAVSPVCLPLPVQGRQEEDPTGKVMTVAGWGNTSPNRRQNAPSRWLLHFVARVEVASLCHAAYGSVDDVQFSPAQHLCVGGASGGGCHGDSGSPLMLSSDGGVGDAAAAAAAAGVEEQASQRVVQYGVLSYGLPDCALRGAPLVYSRVSRHVPWILRHLKPNPFVPKDKTSGSGQMDPRVAQPDHHHQQDEHHHHHQQPPQGQQQQGASRRAESVPPTSYRGYTDSVDFY